ncbi:DUF4199 domain-containing protein [Ulvibacter antarcticus]|uniref:Uncharacterized protein DUF4199 n=1 Tax=Ulvibacter antarcticus TaxID=442714 RepID=A0A3L9Z714_9FLAO|nr:DUF4199 domain-containing protein [Ulvibacter antarcticus]RMA66208.1 uncharacterized protein DUF4199 [Ulvibacter antarcticus]
MKATILRYGLYGALLICVLFSASLIFAGGLDFSTQEIIGYVSMLISLSFVFFGIKHFRDQENNGKVTFGKALLIGVLISLITAVAFGLLDLVYVKYINPDFTAEYYAESLKQLEAKLPAAEFEIKRSEIEAEKELFMSPIMNFAIMASTVLVIGFIISLISSIILQRK